MMKLLLFALSAMAIVICAMPKQALAGERVSSKEWAQEWVRSLKGGSAVFNSATLEKRHWLLAVIAMTSRI